MIESGDSIECILRLDRSTRAHSAFYQQHLEVPGTVALNEREY
jgi:hypothetical protein